MKLTPLTVSFIWILIAVLFFVPFLGNVHLFDWDEINFAEIAREMHVTGNYLEPQINFQAFTEKPPLFFWLQAFSMKLFGVNEFAARFPNALLGILVLPLLYSIGKKLRDHRFGLLWAVVYVGSILPHLYFKSGIIDPWFNFFTFASVYCLINSAWIKEEKRSNTSWIIAGGIFLGLAMLTKGPVALLVLGLTVLTFWIGKKFRMFLTIPQVLLFGITAFLVTGIWIAINYIQRGDEFTIDFFVRQWQLLVSDDAGHGGPFYYHFIVLFFGCFPASVFLIQSFLHKDDGDTKFAGIKKWMAVLFWVVLILFSIVRTKIVHYSSLCYYPLSFLAAVSLYNIIIKKWMMQVWMKVVLVVTAIPFIIAPFALAWFGRHKDDIMPLLKADPFAVENMQAPVHWSGWEFLPGLFLAITLVAFFIYLKKQKLQRAVLLLFIGTAVYTQCTIFFFIKRVEGYSQDANIEFWQSHAKEDCYMTTYGYKSYTQYFYGEMKAHSNKNYTDYQWLITGNIDRPVYISCRVNKKDELEKESPGVRFLYNRNGFYFYERTPLLK